MNKPVCVVLDGGILNPGDISWHPVQSIADCTIYENTLPQDVVARAREARLILTNKVKITREILDQLPKLQYIGELAAGYDNIDITAAKEHGIIVCNTPDYGSISVAQHAFALLLEITNQVALHHQLVQKKEWSKRNVFCFWDTPIIELSKKTLGIIGYGKIGKASAKMAQAFGMHVIAHSRSPLQDDEVQEVSLDQLYEQADVIFLHCPLTSKTKEMINRTAFEKMKDGVILINNSRGGLINDQDLAAALESGKVYGAGLDVTNPEPIKDDNPLLGLPNCFITPHISWASQEARSRIIEITAANIEGFIQNRIKNCVNL